MRKTRRLFFRRAAAADNHREGKAKHNGVHFQRRFLYFINTAPQMYFGQQGGILRLYARSCTVVAEEAASDTNSDRLNRD